MSDARYFIPEHATLKDVYSKDDLRELLQMGRLSRSDILIDDATGLAHLLGDLLRMPGRGGNQARGRPAMGAEEDEEGETDDGTDAESGDHEFRGDTPLPRLGREPGDEFAPDDPEDEDEPSSWEEGEAGEEEDELSGGGVSAVAAPERERLLYHGHPSWLVYPKSVRALFAFGAAAWLFHHLHAGLAWVVVSCALAVLPLLFVALDRGTTSYFITTRRVEVESGLLGRTTREIRMADIRAVGVLQRGYGALVGTGHVMFDSAAGPGSEVVFANVRRPHRLKQMVRELQE